MIGLTDVHLAERDQISKSLEFGATKLTEIRDRIVELQQLERELKDIQKKLLQRPPEIEPASTSVSS
jgi:hypothetical protein